MTLSLLLLAPSIVLASGTVDLDIQNFSSKDTLVIKKENGEIITVPPEGFIKHISFDTNSEPQAFIKDRYVCTWQGIYYHHNLEPKALHYDNPYPHMFKCATIYAQH